MLCPGTGTFRAKHAAGKKEKRLPVARCLSTACLAVFLIFFSSLSSWLQFLQKEEGWVGVGGGGKARSKSRESSEPRTAALLGLAAARRSPGELLLMSLRFPD